MMLSEAEAQRPHAAMVARRDAAARTKLYSSSRRATAPADRAAAGRDAREPSARRAAHGRRFGPARQTDGGSARNGSPRAYRAARPTPAGWVPSVEVPGPVGAGAPEPRAVAPRPPAGLPPSMSTRRASPAP